MVANDCDYEEAKKRNLMERFPFLEMGMFLKSSKTKDMPNQLSLNKTEQEKQIIASMYRSSIDLIEEMPSPRFIKSHLPLSLLPPSLLDTCKVVHVARDPRDVVVSYYYHCKLFLNTNFTGDFNTFWKFFINNQIEHLPYFENLKEWWGAEKPPQLTVSQGGWRDYFDEEMQQEAARLDGG
ncbi:hypothetical protein ACJJTC_011243 [Scirpophaga incertulas]